MVRIRVFNVDYDEVLSIFHRVVQYIFFMCTNTWFFILNVRDSSFMQFDYPFLLYICFNKILIFQFICVDINLKIIKIQKQNYINFELDWIKKYNLNKID